MTAKIPYPRQLNSTESLDTLTHWRSHLRNYFRRDDNYKLFFARTCQWDPSASNYGFKDTESQTAASQADNLESLLDTVAGFMPGPYLTAKITKNTKSMEDVFNVIFTHYDVIPNPSTYLDYDSITLLPDERYIDLYHRLLYHAEQHLVQQGETVAGEKVNQSEKLTHSHRNLIALTWMAKIHKNLTQIVKLEKHKELKAGQQLHTMVQDISKNVDEWLRRNGFNPPQISGDVKRNDTKVINDEKDSNVRNVQFRGGSGLRGTARGRAPFRQYTTRGSTRPVGTYESQRLFCPGCNYLAKELQIKIDFRHHPHQCPRKNTVVRMLHLEEEEIDNCVQDLTLVDSSYAQEEEDLLQEGKQLSSTKQQIINTTYSIDQHKNDHSTKSEYSTTEHNNVENKVNAVFKAKSPTISACLNGKNIYAVIDEGSEISAINATCMEHFNLSYSRSVERAVSAGSLKLPVLGITDQEIILQLPHGNNNVQWNLGQCLVVQNLGCDILIGEPAKCINNILTDPVCKTVKTKDISSNTVWLPYVTKDIPSEKSCVAKINIDTTVYPSHEIHIDVPKQFINDREILVESVNSVLCPPTICNIKQGKVSLSNDSSFPYKCRSDDKLIFTKVDNTSFNVRKIYDINKENMAQFESPSRQSLSCQDVLTKIQLDPHHILSEEWKLIFKNIVESYNDIITDVPGRYNGHFGKINCSLTLTGILPPSVKPRLPSYSQEKLVIMANIMDDMEQWGVLAKPEDLGIIPTHVHPCILVPKDGGKFRLVTDFRNIQNNILQLPTIMPTTAEAMSALASADYHIELDFSNYYWQNSIPREDSEKLAICHPFGGLRVYTVTPQGLRNSAEYGSEILARIYGDMVKERKCTRIADQIYVLGSSLQELAINFKEVLHRGKLANLTFKPSKIVICPVTTIVLGWKKHEHKWFPTEHILSPLSLAEPPSTVKKLRGWLGAYRQIAKTIPHHAIVLQPFEQLVGGKNSKDRIVWSPELLEKFDLAKKSIETSQPITFPRPTDKLKIFPDWSQDADAVGGRLIIEREDGQSTVQLHGGEFSCRLKGAQARWTVCEKECLAIKLLIQQYQPFIRESKHITTVYTDNNVAAQAWQAIKSGKISTSSRVASFISTLCENTVDIVHYPGTQTLVADYNSRNPVECNDPKCQTCKFVKSEIIFNDIYVRHIKESEVPSLDQRSTWLALQKQDPTLVSLYQLIISGQSPEKKVKNKYLKQMHNLFKRGLLYLSNDGLLVVKHPDIAHNIEYQAIVIPELYIPGIVQSMHYKLNHPSQYQLTKVLARQFYCPAMSSAIESVCKTCDICCRLKTLPKEAAQFSTTSNDIFGTQFSADVLKEKGQKIIICREKLSQFTLSKIIADETAETLESALFSMVIDYIPETGATIQVDPAPGFISIAAQKTGILPQHNIKLDIGRVHNVNKNPVAENCIKEFRKEWLRLKPNGEPLSEVERAQITNIINKRIRLHNLAPKEIMLKRSLSDHKTVDVTDSIESKVQFDRRTKANNQQFIRDSIEKSMPKSVNVQVGDLVYIKDDLNKSRSREEYIVCKKFVKDNIIWLILRKTQKGFRAKEYLVKATEVMIIPKVQTQSFAPFVDENDDDGEDFMGFHTNISLEHRDKLKQNIDSLSKKIKNTKVRGRPKVRYPDYLTSLPADVIITDEDETLCGFQDDLSDLLNRKSKLQDIIQALQNDNEQSENDEDFHGFSDVDIEMAMKKQTEQNQYVDNCVISFVKTKHHLTSHPWNYVQWVDILEHDYYQEPCVKRKKISEVKSVIIDNVASNSTDRCPSLIFDDTEFLSENVQDSQDIWENNFISQCNSIIESIQDSDDDQVFETNTNNRATLVSETDPAYLDKIPVLSQSSDSSLESASAPDKSEESVDYSPQIISLDRVADVTSELDLIHATVPCFQSPIEGQVYDMTPILQSIIQNEDTDIQTAQTNNDHTEEQNISTRRTTIKHDYNKVNKYGFQNKS